MKLPNRKKSQVQRVIETLRDSVEVPVGRRSGLPDVGPAALKANLDKRGSVLKAGAVATGLAGLTAGSAGISSFRRRQVGARNDS